MFNVKYILSAALFMASHGAYGKDTPPVQTPPPLPVDWQSTSTMLIKQSVRDAETVRIEFREEPYVMTCKKGVFDKKGPTQILMVNVAVNAQNAFGGYTGFQLWSVAFTHTETISYTKPDGGAITRFGLCKRI